MGYKTILIHSTGDDASRARAELAISVAEMFGAAVYGVAAETWYPTAVRRQFGYFPADVTEGIQHEVWGRLEAAKKVFHEVASAHDRPALWSTSDDNPRDALADAAEAADLVVTDRHAELGSESLAVDPEHLIMETGLPVLLMAEGLRTIHAERVIVAWKNTRETRRAVSDALPFLRRAKETYLLHIAHEADLAPASADLEVAAGRLTRNGVAVRTVALTERRHICEALEAYAKRQGADLIVLGAYGHSRLRETVFGGVTQGFIAGCGVHVLFSR